METGRGNEPSLFSMIDAIAVNGASLSHVKDLAIVAPIPAASSATSRLHSCPPPPTRFHGFPFFPAPDPALADPDGRAGCDRPPAHRHVPAPLRRHGGRPRRPSGAGRAHPDQQRA